MRHNPLKNRKGLTLIEMIIASGLMCLALVATLMIMTTMLSIWAKGASGSSANTYTSLAMRKLVLEMEEGSRAVMLDTFTEDGTVYGKRLQVTFPYYHSGTGVYARGIDGITVTYYLSGPNGTEQGGTSLWKSTGSGNTLLAKNVESLRFVVTNENLVRINLKGRDPEHGAVNPDYLQQSIKLRNS